jgi:hypothetical protein
MQHRDCPLICEATEGAAETDDGILSHNILRLVGLKMFHGGMSGLEITDQRPNLRRIGHEFDENKAFNLRRTYNSQDQKTDKVGQVQQRDTSCRHVQGVSKNIPNAGDQMFLVNTIVAEP